MSSDALESRIISEGKVKFASVLFLSRVCEPVETAPSHKVPLESLSDGEEGCVK